MLEQLTFTGRELLIAVVLASVVYLVEVWVFSRRTRHRRDQSLDVRLRALEAEQASMRTRIEALEARPPAGSALDTQSAVHAEALRLAREGVPPGDLADRLGISRTEAELIIALQKAES